jgi:hypothetical protein
MSARYGLGLAVLVFALALPCATRADSSPPPMRLALLNPDMLEAARAWAASGQPILAAAVQKLRGEADAALTAGPFTVTDKSFLPPSGDKHDYVSLSIYWWPDPNTPDGLPYVNRDGERNPEADKFDSPKLGRMSGAVETLALAYWFTRDERYARHAADLLRVFFLAPATRMNPNLQYGQGEPGHNKGTASGIIETVGLATRVVDAVALLGRSRSWTEADQRGIEAWFSAYLHWLQHSPLGRHEGRAFNNHGTWYDVQVSSFAILLGRPSLARHVLATSSRKRVLAHIAADGSQRWELLRTKSWGYSIYNLEAMFALGAIGDKMGVDLWQFTGSDGRGLRKALDYLIPYADPAAPWPFKQIAPRGAADLLPILGVAALVYGEPSYARLLEKMLAAGAPYRIGNREILSLTDYLLATRASR